jgi:hypothetical protein
LVSPVFSINTHAPTNAKGIWATDSYYCTRIEVLIYDSVT